MPVILEELKRRQTLAQQRHAEVLQRFQRVQAEMQQVQMELNTWNTAVGLETREEQVRTLAAARDQRPLPLATPNEAASSPIVDEVHLDAVEPISKTEAIRELLREHPAGLTSPDLWKGFQLKAPKTDRAYLYSVLKRLRDKDEVMVRRGKYMLKIKPSEIKEENVVVQ